MIERTRYHYADGDAEDKTIGPVKAELGGDELEVHTTGDLAAIIAHLPPDTPLLVSTFEHTDVRIIDDANIEDEPAFVASLVAVAPWGRAGKPLPVADRQPVVGLRLSRYAVVEGEELPEDTRARCPHDRVVAGLQFGRPLDILRGCHELVDDVAGWLGRDDETLLEWVADAADLREQLLIESSRLAQTAHRLAALSNRIAEHLGEPDQSEE